MGVGGDREPSEAGARDGLCDGDLQLLEGEAAAWREGVRAPARYVQHVQVDVEAEAVDALRESVERVRQGATGSPLVGWDRPDV